MLTGNVQDTGTRRSVAAVMGIKAHARVARLLKLIPRTALIRTIFFGAGDLLLWTLSYVGALLLRFDGAVPHKYLAAVPVMLVLFVPVKFAWHAAFRLYRVSWSLIGLVEILAVAKAAATASITLAGALFLLRGVSPFDSFPRSVLALDYLLSAISVGTFRLSRRLYDERFRRPQHHRNGTRVLLVGAGSAGERLARAMILDADSSSRPVGFVDDDETKHGTYIQGLPVLGGREAIAAAVRRFDVEEIVIAIPSAGAGQIRGIVHHAREAGLKRVRVLPSVNELLAGRVTLQDIRDVNLDDLLGREPVGLDLNRVNSFLAGRTLLVTGAGGSIGSELARQLARSDAARLLLLDMNETALFDLDGELAGFRPSQEIQILVADVRDAEKMQRLFARWKPDVVYHAAAYKHVPIMESHPDEAVRTNIFGTLAVAEAALAQGAHTFVLISSDKAVDPTNIMGATKRVAELLMSALNGRRQTRFLAVRFGNVVGSRGSVIPLLQEQIRHGGPVTITHPDMTRYFMSTREAVALILQASAMNGPHDIYVLDMGRPVKVFDLAAELIRLSGFEPDQDIPIVFTGIRPGEKLHEALETADEPLQTTAEPKIHAVTTNGAVDEVMLRLGLQELARLSHAMDSGGLKSILQRLTQGRDAGPAWAPGRSAMSVGPLSDDSAAQVAPLLRHLPVPREET